MTGEIRESPVGVHRSDLVNRSPNHMRAVKIFSEWPRRMVHQITSDQIESRNLACRFSLPVFPSRISGLFQKPIQQVAVMELFDTPAIHKLSDDRILPCRRAS